MACRPTGRTFGAARLSKLSHPSLLLGVATLALGACGGGGGGGPISTPPPPPASPAPTPPPAPTPAPPPSFDTDEVDRSDGPEQHGAITAWQDGTTGQGQTIAIIDTGIDLDSPEFAGRIDARSTYVAGNGTAQEVDDHGTHVALVAAAALDGTGVVGIAHDANILAFRADRPGTCQPGDDASLDGCRFADGDLARAVTRATNANAAVINLSLGGSNPGAALRNAVQEAVAAGVVIVVSAGNDGGTTGGGVDPSNPDRFATGLLDIGGDNVIIVGSVDAANTFSPFSNAAGDSAASFISARGEQVCCIYEDGVLRRTTRDGSTFVTVFSGTSFAAPQVSGAVALLAQAFPTLTGAQIVEILLDTARDAGASGTDRTYGRGILDIAAALAPAGTTRVAGSDTALALADDALIGSPAMGDAAEATTLSTVVLDKYGRAYGYDLGGRLRGAAPQPLLRGVVEGNGSRVSAASGKAALAFTVGGERGDLGATALSQLRLTGEEAQGARVLAGRLALAISPDAEVGFAFNERAEGLVAQLQGAERPAFMIARDPSGDTGFARSGALSFAARHSLGDFGLTLHGESGEAWLGARREASDFAGRMTEKFGTRSLGIALDRAFGPLDTMLGASWLAEDRTVLGGYWHAAFGEGGADTLFIDASLGLDLRADWRLGGQYRQGITYPQAGYAVAVGSRFTSNAFSLDLTKRNTAIAGDSVSLRIAQPLRVTGGGIDVLLPTAYDYATGRTTSSLQSISLTPEGRELMAELMWQGPLAGGYLSGSAYLRREPGHYETAPDDAGVALRWSTRF